MDSNCELKTDEDLNKWYEGEYDKFDSHIKSLKLAKPALRALINNKIYKKSDLKKFSLDEIKTFHGIGPNALKKLGDWLK